METVVSLFRDGRFVQTLQGPTDLVIAPFLARWDGGHAPGALDGSWWLYGGQARQRPACPVVADGLSLRGVRPDSTITIEGRQYPCADGGDVELSFQFPGTYEVTVARWPYLDGRYTIENPSPTK